MSFNFTLKTKKIEFADGSVTVRGLSVPDLTQLVLVNKPAALELWNQFGKKKSLSNDDQADLIMSIATKFPTVIQHIIALAADEPDGFERAGTLPIDVQVAIIEQVATMTFSMSGGLKNFVETLKRIGQNAQGLEQKLITSP